MVSHSSFQVCGLVNLSISISCPGRVVTAETDTWHVDTAVKDQVEVVDTEVELVQAAQIIPQRILLRLTLIQWILWTEREMAANTMAKTDMLSKYTLLTKWFKLETCRKGTSTPALFLFIFHIFSSNMVSIFAGKIAENLPLFCRKCSFFNWTINVDINNNIISNFQLKIAETMGNIICYCILQ